MRKKDHQMETSFTKMFAGEVEQKLENIEVDGDVFVEGYYDNKRKTNVFEVTVLVDGDQAHTEMHISTEHTKSQENLELFEQMIYNEVREKMLELNENG